MLVGAVRLIPIFLVAVASAAHGRQADSCSSGALPLFRQKQYQEAERRLQICLAANPDDSSSHELLGLVLAQSGQPEPAGEHLRQALKLARANDDYRFNLAMFLAEGERIDEADEVAEPLLESRPGADVYSLVGFIRLRQHQEREAAEWFEKAVSAAPGRSQAWYRLGFCRQALGQFPQAISAYRNVIALDSSHALARLQLGKVLLLQGKYGDAMTELEESVRLDPERASSWRYLSQGQLLCGKFEAARESAGKAVTLGPSDPRNYYQLGLAAQKLGNDADADSQFQTMEKLRAEQRSSAKPLNSEDY
jgi:Flp pilus assembly protein TadD